MDEYVKHWSAMATDVCISGCPVKGLLQKPPDLFYCMGLVWSLSSNGGALLLVKGTLAPQFFFYTCIN